MFDRFSDRARKCMTMARQEAVRLNHDYIGPEHILLAILREGSGVAANVLENLDVDLNCLGTATEARLVAGPPLDLSKRQIPFTPPARKVLEFAVNEAWGMRHNYVGTEHLILGLLREPRGLAALTLEEFGLRLEGVRAEIRTFLGVEGSSGGQT